MSPPSLTVGSPARPGIRFPLASLSSSVLYSCGRTWMDCSAVAVHGTSCVTSAVMPTTSVPLPLDAELDPAELDGDALEQPATSRAAAAEPTASALAPRRFGFFIDPPSDRMARPHPPTAPIPW